MLWKSWSAVGSVAVVGFAAYAGLLLLQRFSGKRTLSKLNAFDLIVTVALGSTLATTILSPDVSLAEGLAGFAVLILCQYTVTLLSVRLAPFKRLVKASPTHLVRNGEQLREAMARQRVTEDELLQAVRSSGRSSLQGVDVVLETNGKLSVIDSGNEKKDALVNVK